MLKRKSVKKRGKIAFSEYFKELKEGDTVAVVKEHAVLFNYSHRLQGRTGQVVKKRGKAYEVEINDLNRAKRYMIRPIHLRRIAQQ